MKEHHHIENWEHVFHTLISECVGDSSSGRITTGDAIFDIHLELLVELQVPVGWEMANGILMQWLTPN